MVSLVTQSSVLNCIARFRQIPVAALNIVTVPFPLPLTDVNEAEDAASVTLASHFS